jgi:predicted nucleotidyltransferase
MIKEDIKNYFFINPTVKLRVREIERILKLPIPSVIRYCKELEKEKILSAIQIGKIKLYTARREEKYFFEKKLFNLKSIYESGVINNLKIELSNPGVVLFGSYSKGEDIENSDVDLYIETVCNKKINLKKFEQKLQRKIQIFRQKNIKDISNKHLANNIVNGVTLNNHIEVF